MNVQYTQPGYFDLGEEAARIQVSHHHQRQRLLGALRGYLRETTSPRWTLLTLLAEAFFGSAILSWLACHWGIRHTSILAVLFFTSAWPIFLLLLRRQAGREFRRLQIDRQFEHFIRLDETAQAFENAPAGIGTQRKLRAFSEAFGQQYDSDDFVLEGLDLLFLLTLATGGTWLIYNLIRSGPQLIAQMLLDAHYAPAHPNLYRRIESGSWFRNVGASTAVHFLALAIVSLLLIAGVQLLVDINRPEPVPQMPAGRPVGAVWRLGASHAAPGRSASPSTASPSIVSFGHAPERPILAAAPAKTTRI